MLSSRQATPRESERIWRMPIAPEDYDRSPLTDEERRALEIYATVQRHNNGSKEFIAARKGLTRLDRPVADIYRLRHNGSSSSVLKDVQCLLRREMHRRQKMYWDWSSAEWVDLLCPNSAVFRKKYRENGVVRVTIMDMAYLLGTMNDLQSVGMRDNATSSANVYFGSELVRQQGTRIFDILKGKGYSDGESCARQLLHNLSMLFILNRSPFLEDIHAELLAAQIEGSEASHKRRAYGRIWIALEELNHLPSRQKEEIPTPRIFDKSGMVPEWYDWCMAWYEHEVDLTPRLRASYASRILVVGRWLHQHFPEICTPEQWTEDLALHFRSDLCSWTNGQYASGRAKQILEAKRELGLPLQARAVGSYLTVLRRYFTDLTKRPHAVSGKPARKIRLDFAPGEALADPAHIRRAKDRVAPRDIDLLVWAKLAIAAATLSENDLPRRTHYPLSYYRAVGLVWVTSARRPNEILRLRLDCVREDWDLGMLDEDDHPVERIVPAISDSSGGQKEKKIPKIFYLHIPAGKNKGAFWIWIPDYTAYAIEAWKRERPGNQKKFLDWKDQQHVDYLFCFTDGHIGPKFINRSLIPTLCAKAGIDVKDAKGKITGHRGRSTRLTLLRRNGVSLEDLAEYAGHANTRTLRNYVPENMIQFQHEIKKADELTRVIEGVLDMQAASQGLPAVRWFIGYDADGQPVYCGNQVYVTCPHRLDCKRCGMFIGGEKARRLHNGENTLPIQSQVPMTPIEKCVVDGDEAGAEACRAALQDIPAPETPELALIFNPEGLSNLELEKLAEMATPEALDKLRQALDAHEKKLAEVKQTKTGRNAIVSAQKKRIGLIQHLILECERSMADLEDGTQRMA